MSIRATFSKVVSKIDPDQDTLIEHHELEVVPAVGESVMLNGELFKVVDRSWSAYRNDRGYTQQDVFIRLEPCGASKHDADSDSCPGCDAKPGDGITASCDHPEGCGYWKSIMESTPHRDCRCGSCKSCTYLMNHAEGLD